MSNDMKTQQEKIEDIKKLRLIDDVFFEAFAENKEAVEEILRVILNDEQLVVLDVITQSSERNLYGRSVRLDALVTLGDGRKCNVEVQRSDNDDHARRVRYNGSMITVKDSNPGDRFEDVVNVIIIYISEFDFLKGGKPIYHVDKIVRETKERFEDGFEEVFVNTAVSDGSRISRLMSCFQRPIVQDDEFPKTSAEFTRLKTTEGGLRSMCKLMEKYTEEARAEGRAEGHAEGENEGKIKTLAMLVQDGDLPVEKAAGRLSVSVEEFKKLAMKFAFML